MGACRRYAGVAKVLVVMPRAGVGNTQTTWRDPQQPWPQPPRSNRAPPHHRWRWRRLSRG
uniref:Uncharacterized protein n=1 Tax=Oryza barthii TaxID=65489 RepID=A0A0D3G6E6_9ORYZ